MWDEAEKVLKGDKHLGPLIEKYGPCKIIKHPKSKYFESIVRDIIGQQLSVKAASTIYSRLEDMLEVVTPETIIKSKHEELRKLGLSNAKAWYVTDLSERVLDKRLHLDKLDNMDDDAVKKELIEVKGIGKWTAEMFLMFTLARPDIFPIEDLGLRNGFKKVVGDYSNEKMEKYAKRWSPYRTVASWYLWQSLENEPIKEDK